MPEAPAVGAGDTRAVLRRWAAADGPLATRARVVLLADEGVRDAEIARRLGVSRQTVGTWRHRWRTAGLAGLEQRPRTGRPVTVDEAEVVTRGLLAPGGGASRTVARELGLSHATVAAVRRRWRLVPGAPPRPRVPTRPPLPDADTWVIGLYADPYHGVLVLGTAPDEPAAGAADPALGADVLACLDGALDAVRATPHGTPPAPGRGPAAHLAAVAARHPGLAPHAVTLWGDEPPATDGAVRHRLPARSTWRGLLHALVALDSARHPESSRRVYLDLLAALERAPGEGPLRWLREPVPGTAPRGAVPHPGPPGGDHHPDPGSYNECLVIESVRLAGGATRGEIAERTGLTQQSVSRIARTLLDRGVLMETGRQRTGSGKPRTPVRVRPGAAHALGLHLDPEVLTAVVTDLDGATVALATRPVDPGAAPAAYVAEAAELARETRETARGAVRPDGFLGIGVAVPGPVDIASGTVLGPPLLSSWRDLPLVSMLKEHLDCPVAVEKDALAAAAGERWVGRDRRARDFAYLYLGTGVGAGLCLGGDLYRGVSANAGEFGQLCALALGRVDADGRPELLPECNPPAYVAGRAAFGGPGAYHAAGRAAAAGDPAARETLRTLARAIGRGALGLVDLLDLDLIVLGGPFFTDDVAGFYLTEIATVVNEFPTARRLRRVEVERALLNTEAAATGAASTLFHAAFGPRGRARGAR
ncbi:ROK family protein [Streptomyces sp. NPDC050560]|uniref:ROK family protein n=1 Tax=Streptomyces sp. NPDC050560 TaxID=3365630 RepID=UPI0037B76D98